MAFEEITEQKKKKREAKKFVFIVRVRISTSKKAYNIKNLIIQIYKHQEISRDTYSL